MDNYEKSLNMRKKVEDTSTQLKIFVQKDGSPSKNNNYYNNNEKNLKSSKSSKYNHFNIKIKDYSSLMLSAKSISTQKNMNTIE